MTQVALIIGASDRQCPGQELAFARAQRARERAEAPAHLRAYLQAFEALLRARGDGVGPAVERMRRLAPRAAGGARQRVGLDGLLVNLEEYR